MGYLSELVNPANWDVSPVWLDGAPQGYSEVEYIGDPVFVEAKAELDALNKWLADLNFKLVAAQHRVYLTAFGVGMLAFCVGFGVCWLVFVR